MSEYRRLLGHEFVGLSTKWFAGAEVVVNVAGYAISAYLWWKGAANWQVMAVGGLSAFMTVAFVYFAGKRAWEKEHGRRIEAEANLTGTLNNKALADRLTELRRDGLHDIRNAYEDDRAHIKRYRQLEREWSASVEKEMRAGGCTAPEISSFMDVTHTEIGESSGEFAAQKYGPEGGGLIGLMEIRLKRLGRIIEHYSAHKLFD